MMNDKPLVSIGLPVYNGEKYIELALDSLVSQDYKNFELIISDNASTDGTLGICKRYADRDARIAVIENAENHGASWNFQHVRDLARGSYFMWAAHDDLWDPNYISACVALLDCRPNAVVCCSRVLFIDEDGEPVDREFENLDTTGEGVADRLRTLLSQHFWCAIYGVMRTDQIQQITVGRRVWGADVVLLLEMLLSGEIVCSDDACLYYRVFHDKSIETMYHDIDPNRRDWPRHAPYTEMIVSMLKVVHASKLARSQKLKSYTVIANMALVSGPFLPQVIKVEQHTQFFRSYGQSDRRGVLHSAPLAFAMNPEMLWNRGAWSMLIRSLLAR